MFYTLLWIGLVLQLVRATQAEEKCTEVTGGEANTCKTCGAIIGGVSYCSQCNDSGSTSAPTDGACTADNNECTQKEGGVCTQCAQSSFMYKGGCYKTANGPGNMACEAAQDGKCTTAKAGYFLPPDADRDNAHQSVIPCGDEEEITVKNNHKYKGVPHCIQCDAPTAASDANAKAATCTACEDGFFGATCEACQDENCATCAVTGSNKCSKCKTTGTKTYLKVDSGSTGTCVEASACTGATFPKVDQQGNKCAGCNSVPDGGIDKCATCNLLTQGSRVTPLVTCLTCEQSKYLTPEKNACLDACPAGSYATGQACTPCDPSCAECSGAGASRCTACPAGKMLRYADEGKLNEGGQCVEGCVEGPECEACGLTIGGTKYCSKCKGSNVPLNGVCTSNAARAQFCTTAADGACTVCAAGYFIQGGGCYKTDRLPGKSICTTDNGGKCQACANGQNPDGGTGVCPLCDSTCKTCTAGQTQQCQSCFSGYYKSGTKCVKCDASDSGITGVSGCVSCAPPSNSQGSVTCYTKKDNTDNGGGDSGNGESNTNRGGLSTGAIAGISVAVVVVVGGLVGFLCWWFICRGKA
ncbi:VSP [Giardia lamblia P15]|uniref:VSP n=1 Tax=Giardia intestinalis (strain P15) TaxID=658858 RepID=E1F477_GIAIA|nr:VSP [Giardia lamblia P15]